MRVRFVCLTYLIAYGLFAAESVKRDKGLDGVWKPVAGERAGRAMGQETLSAITLTIKNLEYDVFVSTESQHDRGTTKVDPSAKPKTIDIVGTNGPNQGKTLLAIYERKGDVLKVCYDLAGVKRPTEFKAPAGTTHLFLRYERETKARK